MSEDSLRKVPLFAQLDDDELAKVAAMVTREAHPAGSTLFACGDLATAFYLIEEGTIEVRIPATAVALERRIEMGPGDFFGEMGVIRGRPRMAEAVAKTDVALQVVSGADFDELLSVDAAVSEKVTAALRARVAEARPNEQAAEASLADPHCLLFVATGPGAGASFLAANLAVKLKDLTGERVLVLDMRLAAPSQRKLLGVEAGQGVLAAGPGAMPDVEGMLRSAASSESGVDLLCATPGAKDLSPQEVDLLIATARRSWSYVLVDAGGKDEGLDAELARVCDVVNLVVQPQDGAAAGASTYMAQMKAAGLDGRIRLVANQVPEGADLEGFEFELGEELAARIPLARAAADVEEAGPLPYVRAEPRAKASVAMTRLARELLHLPDQKSGLASLPVIGWFLGNRG